MITVCLVNIEYWMKNRKEKQNRLKIETWMNEKDAFGYFTVAIEGTKNQR